MKKYTGIILILILGLYLRLNPYILESGCNFDELAMTSIAALKFPFEILKNCALLDYHAPLYYLVAHFFTYFNDETLYLRLFNLILSLANIFIFYKIGLELKNKNFALLLAFALAINHEHISSVSFVKFYTLCFLLISISFYYFLKTVKDDKFWLKLGIINAFYCFSSTLGLFYILGQYIILFLIKKESKKAILKSLLVSMAGFSAYCPILLIQTKIALTNIISPHSGYAGANAATIYYFLNDYFSPLLNYCCQTETISAGSMFLEFIKYKDFFALLMFVIFSLIPVIVGLFGVYKSLKNKNAKILFYSGAIFFIIFFALSFFEIIGFIPFYVYPAGFIFLICAYFGLSEIKNKTIKIILLIAISFPQIFISNYYPIEKMDENYNKIFDFSEKYLKNAQKNNENKIFIATTGGRFLAARYNNVFNFDYEQAGGCHDKTIVKLVFGKDLIKKANKKNIRELVKPIILNNIKNPEFDKYIDENLIKKLKKGDCVIYMINADDCPYLMKDEEIKKVLNSKNYDIKFSSYKQMLKGERPTTLSDMEEAINTYSNKCLIENLDKKLKRVKIEQFIETDRKNCKKSFETANFNHSTLWIAQNAIEGWIFVTYQKE